MHQADSPHSATSGPHQRSARPSPGLPAAETLQFLCWRPCLPVPGREGAAQVVPVKSSMPGPL